LVFVDGGNLELLSAPNFSVQLLRVCAVKYKNNERVFIKRVECFCVVNSFVKRSENSVENSAANIWYKVKIYPIDEADSDFFESMNGLEINSQEESISSGGKRAKISSVVNVVRRFLEIDFAKNMISELLSGFIILDGTLEANYPGEIEKLTGLCESAKKKEVTVCALSKTTNLFTSNSNSAPAYLNSLSPFNKWYYYPSVKIASFNENHSAEIYFLKLNEHSDYVFRFEINKSPLLEGDFLDKLFWLLEQNSKDAVFLGYPYGLIEVDKFARIEKKEAEALQILFLSKISSNFHLLNSINALNAHDILDRIS